MNTPLLRGSLNAIAIDLAVVGMFGLFWSLAWAWAIALAAVLVIVADLIHWCSDRRGGQPPFTSQYGCSAHSEVGR